MAGLGEERGAPPGAQTFSLGFPGPRPLRWQQRGGGGGTGFFLVPGEKDVVGRGSLQGMMLLLSRRKMSSTVTGSLPPEGHHGGHLGGWGDLGVWRTMLWGGFHEPQPSCLLLSVSSGTEGKGTWLPDPPLCPDYSHPEAWLGLSLRIQPWG